MSRALAVACPTCGARRGIRCRRLSDGTYARGTHSARHGARLDRVARLVVRRFQRKAAKPTAG